MTDGPLRLEPAPAGRPWGGRRFGSVDGLPVGELWVSGDDARLPDGRTLAAAGLAVRLPLVKLLDVAGLLSVQVHPDDAEARALRGPDAVGKHEMWVILEAAAGASLYLGAAPGTSAEDLASGDEARVVAALRERSLPAGSAIDVPPGTVHAPGPGLLLYEIQQRSDLTFRLFDWGRDRPLHLEEARRCLRPDADPLVGPLPDGVGRHLVSAPGAPFRLELLRPETGAPLPVALDGPAVLSVAEGALAVDGVACAAGSHWLLPGGGESGVASPVTISGDGWGLLARLGGPARP